MPRFVSEPIVAEAGAFDTGTASRGEPSLPPSFRWHGERLDVAAVRRTWRSTKSDRGDAYLDKHYFAIALPDGREAVVYFHRRARGDAPRWWLYTIEEPAES